MAKKIATQWVRNHLSAEYRLTIYHGQPDNIIRNLPRLLKAFRDGRVKIAQVDMMSDLGIHTRFDSIEVWSSNREGLVQIRDWLEKRGYETAGVW